MTEPTRQTAPPTGERVGVRELRQNLSTYLARVKEGESLVVTEHGKVVARLTPEGERLTERQARLLERYPGTKLATRSIREIAASMPRRHAPQGTTDRLLAEQRRERS